MMPAASPEVPRLRVADALPARADGQGNRLSEEETGAPFATVDRTNWLSCTFGRFKTNPPRILLPRDIRLEYREHLKNLVRTYEKDETGNLLPTT